MAFTFQVPASRSRIAALLDDGLADRRPRFERSLVQVLLSVVEYPPVGDLRTTATALDRLMDGNYRNLVVDGLTATAGAGAARRATTATILDLMRFVAGTTARQQSVHLTRSRLHLPDAEEEAVQAFSNPWRLPDDHRATESVADAVARAVASLDLDETATRRLTQGLAAVGASQFTLTETEPTVAVLTAVDVVDPIPLLDVVNDPDLSTALELGLSSLPAEHWSIPGLIAATVYAANSRQPVGEQIVSAVNATTGP